jgi:hypothetical protein
MLDSCTPGRSTCHKFYNCYPITTNYYNVRMGKVNYPGMRVVFENKVCAQNPEKNIDLSINKNTPRGVFFECALLTLLIYAGS